MEKRNYLPIAGLITLIFGCLCGICAGVSIIVTVVRSSNETIAQNPTMETLKVTDSLLTGVTHTATQIPDNELTETTATATSILSNGQTPFPALTLTPNLTYTFGLTTTATQIPTESYDINSPDIWCLPWNSKSTSAQVIRVMDGITIEVSIAGRNEMVRYIGIDMIEAPTLSAERAATIEQNKMLVADKTVLLVKDVVDSDEQGRLLRYVISDGVFVNRELVESGYAVAESYPPNTSCDAVFSEAEYQARAFQRGLWAPTPTPQITRYIPSATPTPNSSGQIAITVISFEGTPWEEADEFVEIKNVTNVKIQLQGWTLRNSEGYTFVFPSFIMSPGWYCRIYTNEYHPASCGFSFNRPSPVWDNFEDCAYLRDAVGNLIDQFCYE